MKIIIKENRHNIIETTAVKAVIKVSAFNSEPLSVLKSTFQAAGDLLVGTGSGTYTRLQKGANGTWLGVDSVTGDLAYGSIVAGGTTFTMTNGSLSTIDAGMVVILDYSAASKMNTSSVPQDRRVIGVAKESIASSASGLVARGGAETVLVQGNVAIGEWLVQSATTGRAKAAGFNKPYGGCTIGIAITAYAGGGAGSVTAILIVDTQMGASAGNGYMFGAITTVVVGTITKLTGASETNANISSALSTTRCGTSGMSDAATYGWIIGGSTTGSPAGGVATSDKFTIATDTSAYCSSANMVTVKSFHHGGGLSTFGWTLGGWSTSTAYGTVATKTVFATDTSSTDATAVQPTGKVLAGPATDTLELLAAGGQTGSSSYTTETTKTLVSTSVTSAVAGAAISVARGYMAGVFNTLAAYFAGGYVGSSTGSTVTDKCTLATLTTAALGTASLSAAKYSPNGSSLPLAGYLKGGTNTGGGKTTTVEKITFATDTISTVSSAAMPQAEDYSSVGDVSVAV